MENTIPYAEINGLIRLIKETQDFMDSYKDRPQGLEYKQYKYLNKRYARNLNKILKKNNIDYELVEVSK